MGKWSYQELETCFQRFMDVTDTAFIRGDLEPWVQFFTDDAAYRDLGYGFEGGWKSEIRGQANIRKWINAHFSTYPNNAMSYWPVPWYIIDEERGWVLCEWRNRMRDPGNGAIFEEKNYTRLKYAGDMKWSFEEDIYNPVRMRTMIELWRHERDRCERQNIQMPEARPEDAPVMHKEVSEQSGENQYSKEEIEDTVLRFEEAGDRAFRTGDHSEWLSFYTDDVVYREHGFGFNNGFDCQVSGVKAVKEWIDPHCDIWPINNMVSFPISWYVIDAVRGWVILEYRNIMKDPGDGTHLECRSYTRLKYAGNGKWCFEEDIYSPLLMRSMLEQWVMLSSRFEK